MTRPAVEEAPSSRFLSLYIALVVLVALAVGVASFLYGRRPEPAPLLLLCCMGLLSFNLREPNVGSRIGFSFLSIILLASGVILGPFGTWCVGFVSVAFDPKRPWTRNLFNVAMTSNIGAVGAWAYVLARGESDLSTLVGPVALAAHVGLPIMVADVVQCLTNAVLLSGVIHYERGAPFTIVAQRVLTGSGVAYVGYGVIGFLFVILWFPADLGAFSALLVLAPLLAARWAFIQYGEESRSHERTIDTLVTALGTKEPRAMGRSRRTARIAEWIAEELGLGPHQIGTIRYAATLHEIGHLGVPSRILRREPDELSEAEQRILERHCVIGAHMIEGIDFLEDARSGVRHQNEHYDGSGGPDGLGGADIPLAARVVAVAARLETLTREQDPDRLPSTRRAVRALEREVGRYDPAVVEAARVVLDKHVWPLVPAPVGGGQ